MALHAWTLAQIFGIDASQVHLTSPYLGGGFGGKTVWSHHVLGAAAAKLAGCPVRIVLSREGVYRLVGGRTNTEQRVAIGARDDGRFTALIHTGISAMTSYNALAEQFTFPARHLYATETLKTDQQVADMDMLANTFMRAPGESVGTFALESAIDELAVELGWTRSSCGSARSGRRTAASARSESPASPWRSPMPPTTQRPTRAGPANHPRQAALNRRRAVARLARFGQYLDVAVRSVHADPLPIPDHVRRVFNSHDRRQAVLACDYRAVGHQAPDLRH